MVALDPRDIQLRVTGLGAASLYRLNNFIANYPGLKCLRLSGEDSY